MKYPFLQSTVYCLFGSDIILQCIKNPPLLQPAYPVERRREDKIKSMYFFSTVIISHFLTISK